MFGEQTFDIVDTAAPDRRDWPSFNDFYYPEEICLPGVLKKGSVNCAVKLFFVGKLFKPV